MAAKWGPLFFQGKNINYTLGSAQKLFGPNKDKVSGKFRMLHNE